MGGHLLGAAFFYRTCHSFFLQDSRIALVTDITAILQNPCYHIFVPDPSNIVWNLLLPKPLNQAVVGFSGDIRLEDMLYQHCLRWMKYDFTQFHVIAEGQFPISHQRTVLSMVSVSSNPFFRRNRSCSLLSTIILSISSPNSSASKASRKSGPASKISISSCV